MWNRFHTCGTAIPQRVGALSAIIRAMYPNREQAPGSSACNASRAALASGLEPVPSGAAIPGGPLQPVPQRGGSMSTNVHRRFTAPLAVLAAAGLTLSACTTGGSGGDGPGDFGEADGVVTIY